jgi:tetratricopeptide (TPR) repeat protein
MRRLVAIAASVVCVVGAWSAPRAASWSRVETPHFIVSGDAPAGAVQQVAFLLEIGREVFGGVLRGTHDRALLPPFVVVFDSDRAFDEYKPRVGDHSAPIAGYLVREPFAPCIALRVDRSRETYRTIFHEYAHLLFDAPGMPLWLSEGMAEYYSTATLNFDRRRVLLGAPVPPHLTRLSHGLMPLRELLATTRQARIWDTDAGATFYAESWALVHLLMRGAPGRGGEIGTLFDALARGADGTAAFERAVGPVPVVERELLDYLRNGMAPPEEVVLPTRVLAQPSPPRSMSDAEVDATLGRLLFCLDRDDDASARLEAALRLAPSLTEAHVTLGLLRLRQGRPADALEPLRAANAREPGNLLVAYDFALAALRAHDEQRPSPLDEGYAALARTLPAAGRPEMLGLLGTIAGRLGRLDDAERLLRRTLDESARQRRTELELADVCLRLGKFDEARGILSHLATQPDDAVAQRRGWLAMAEARNHLRSELAEAAGLPGPGPDRGIERTGTFPSPPAFRAPRGLEQRRAGLLDGFECTDRGITARVTSAGGPLRLTADGFGEVEVISYRADRERQVVCGPRPGREPVLVTWTPGAAIAPPRGATPTDGRLVAVEFLPADLGPDR